MSLIHEALRKARREAAHHDDPGVVYPGGLTGSRQPRGLGTGFVLGVSAAVIICAILAGALWWGLRTPSAPSSSVTAEGQPTDSSTRVADPIEHRDPDLEPEEPEITVESKPGQSSSAADAVSGDTVRPIPTLVTHSPQLRQSEASSPPRAVSTPISVERDEQTTSEGRVFEVEADVGHATLILDYIVYRATDSYAQINGLEVRAGSHIEGFTVDEITADHVRLSDADGPLVLAVPENIDGESESP